MESDGTNSAIDHFRDLWQAAAETRELDRWIGKAVNWLQRPVRSPRLRLTEAGFTRFRNDCGKHFGERYAYEDYPPSARPGYWVRIRCPGCTTEGVVSVLFLPVRDVAGVAQPEVEVRDILLQCRNVVPVGNTESTETLKMPAYYTALPPDLLCLLLKTAATVRRLLYQAADVGEGG